jgi:threonine dehydrogenase-like Zn-dependent dehydrogenase
LYGAALAKARGARVVVGLDMVAGRRELSKRFGVDHAIDPGAMSEAELVKKVRSLCPPDGADAVIEVCGYPEVIPAGIQFRAHRRALCARGARQPGSVRADRREPDPAQAADAARRAQLSPAPSRAGARLRYGKSQAFSLPRAGRRQVQAGDVGKAMQDAAGRKVLRAAIVP